MFVSCQTCLLEAVCKYTSQKTAGWDNRLQILRLQTGFFSHLGRMIFSLGSSEAKSLKVLNLTGGGWRKGLAPKLNSHCWYDIKLAAAKKPDLTDTDGGKKEEIKKFVCELIWAHKIEEGHIVKREKRSGKGRTERKRKEWTEQNNHCNFRWGTVWVRTYVAEEKTCFSGSSSCCPFR